MRRMLLVLAILSVAVSVFARGPREEPEAAPAGEPAQTEPTEQAGAGTEEMIPLDDATAQVLFSMGLMPFKGRLPSLDFTLALLEGGEKSLSDYRGKVVFLNFWATWCPPCREEMPSMQELYDLLAPEGLEIVAVNVLESDDVVSSFIEENGFTYPVLLDKSGYVSNQYNVRAYPTTYILDRDGNVIAVRPGFHEWATPDMIENFRTLLAQ